MQVCEARDGFLLEMAVESEYRLPEIRWRTYSRMRLLLYPCSMRAEIVF